MFADFGKRQFRSETPTCLACASESRSIDYAILGLDPRRVLSRCHDELTVQLLMKHNKVSPRDVLDFLKGELCSCIHCGDDAGYMEANWLLVHLEENHNGGEIRSAFAALVVHKARDSGSPPLTLL